MTKYLITNSDDFGLTNSITDAIIDTHINGIMTSTTLMANMEGFDYAVKKAKEIKTLGVGIHFNLTEGTAISEPSKIPDLVTEEGVFKCNSVQRKNLLFGKNKFEQIKLELNNQLEMLLDNGITPTHFDSHHHITGVPLAFQASILAAKNHGIKRARITNIDFTYSSIYKGSTLEQLKRTIVSSPKAMIHNRNKKGLRKKGFSTPDTKVLPSRVLPKLSNHIDQFLNTLSVLKPGRTEISFHPGYLGSYPEDSEKTAILRIRDLEVANSPLVKEYIQKKNIKLINFIDL